MWFCLKPAPVGNRESGGVWINTDHIASVREVRNGQPPAELLTLNLTMVTGEINVVSREFAGEGTAERVLGWLRSQDSLPPAPETKPEPAKEPLKVKKEAA